MRERFMHDCQTTRASQPIDMALIDEASAPDGARDPGLVQDLRSALRRFAFRTCYLKPLIADAILQKHAILDDPQDAAR